MRRVLLCELVERTGLIGDAARAHDSDLDQAPRTPLRTPLEVVKQDTERDQQGAAIADGETLRIFEQILEEYSEVFTRLA